MNDSILPARIQDWLVETIGSGAALQSARYLPGSTTATLYSLEMLENGHPLDLVLRLFTLTEWITEEPDAPLREAAALNKAVSTGLSVPELVALDASGVHCGVPALLMTRVPGRVDLRPASFEDWLHRLALAAAQIHAVSGDDFGWSHDLWYDLDKLQPPQWSRYPDHWARAIEIVRGPQPDDRTCFIHRDYHPTNVLWQGSQISGVVDWVSACRGAAGVDVGHCRLNLASMYGVAAADTFLQSHESLSGQQQHPYWDLETLLDVMPEWGLYQPWLDFGLTDLTEALVLERMDDYLITVLARLE